MKSCFWILLDKLLASDLSPVGTRFHYVKIATQEFKTDAYNSKQKDQEKIPGLFYIELSKILSYVYELNLISKVSNLDRTNIVPPRGFNSLSDNSTILSINHFSVTDIQTNMRN